MYMYMYSNPTNIVHTYIHTCILFQAFSFRFFLHALDTAGHVYDVCKYACAWVNHNSIGCKQPLGLDINQSPNAYCGASSDDLECGRYVMASSIHAPVAQLVEQCVVGLNPSFLLIENHWLLVYIFVCHVCDILSCFGTDQYPGILIELRVIDSRYIRILLELANTLSTQSHSLTFL